MIRPRDAEPWPDAAPLPPPLPVWPVAGHPLALERAILLALAYVAELREAERIRRAPGGDAHD